MSWKGQREAEQIKIKCQHTALVLQYLWTCCSLPNQSSHIYGLYKTINVDGLQEVMGITIKDNPPLKDKTIKLSSHFHF